MRFFWSRAGPQSLCFVLQIWGEIQARGLPGWSGSGSCHWADLLLITQSTLKIWPAGDEAGCISRPVTCTMLQLPWHSCRICLVCTCFGCRMLGFRTFRLQHYCSRCLAHLSYCTASESAVADPVRLAFNGRALDSTELTVWSTKSTMNVSGEPWSHKLDISGSGYS